jgi:F-type H+-transporting ATPase subunit alpha
MVELLKQDQYVPLPVEKQAVLIYAGINGHTDKLPVESLKSFEQELYRYVDEKHPDLWDDLKKKKEIDDDVKKKLDKMLKGFGKRFVAGSDEPEKSEKPEKKSKKKDKDQAAE